MKVQDGHSLSTLIVALRQVLDEHGDLTVLDVEGFNIEGLRIETATEGSEYVKEWNFKVGEKFVFLESFM